MRRKYCVRVLSESANLVKLTRKSLYMIMEQFPAEYKKLRRREAFLALGRLIVMEAREKKAEDARREAELNGGSLTPRVKNDQRESIVERALNQATIVKEELQQQFRVAERLDELKELGNLPQRLQVLEVRQERQTALIEQLIVAGGGIVPPAAPAAAGPDGGSRLSGIRRQQTSTLRLEPIAGGTD